MLTVEPSAGNGAGAYGQSLSIITIMDIHSQKAGVLFQSAATGDQPGQGVLSQSFIYSVPTSHLFHPNVFLTSPYHFAIIISLYSPCNLFCNGYRLPIIIAVRHSWTKVA